MKQIRGYLALHKYSLFIGPDPGTYSVVRGHEKSMGYSDDHFMLTVHSTEKFTTICATLMDADNYEWRTNDGV